MKLNSGGWKVAGPGARSGYVIEKNWNPEFRPKGRIHTMTRTDLIDTLASRFPGLAAMDSEIAVKLILEAIGDALAQGNRIEVRGFGSFSLGYRPARIARNPMSGQAVSVPAKYVPHFKAGKELCERVNQSGKLYALRQALE